MDTYWKTAFRHHMKEHKITYAQLAEHLNMSVPGVKKIFQKGDISLERFTQICGFIGIDPADLVGKISKNGLKVKFLSPAADAYLTKDPHAFHLYWLLAVERLALDEVANEMKISKAEIYRILRRLDKFDLIKWLNDDEIELPDDVPFVFDRSSASAVKFAKNRALHMVERGFDKKPQKNSLFSLRYVSLPPHKVAEVSQFFTEQMNELSKTYSYKGRKQVKGNGCVPVHILLCLSPVEMS